MILVRISLNSRRMILISSIYGWQLRLSVTKEKGLGLKGSGLNGEVVKSVQKINQEYD